MQGIPMFLGRDFLPEEGVPGKDEVVVLTHKLWNELGADRTIIGKTMQVDGKPHTVVGVLSPGVPDRLGFEMAAPLAFTPEQINHEYHWVLVMGRLKPGVTLQQAQSDMDAVTAHIAATYPKSNTGWGARVDPLKNDFLPPERIDNLWFLLGAVGFVLLITCANVANLLLASGAGRQREIAIRTSMGASRTQVFLQFLTESLLLASLGGALGIAFGKFLIRVVLAIVPEGILPSEANFQLDPPVLIAALAVTTLAGLLFGCAPAWYASRTDPQEALKDGGRSTSSSRSNKLRRLLIIGEFSLALSLLAGAGLAIHSFWNLTRVDLGVQTDHVLTFQLNQPQTRFASPAEMNTYNDQVMAAVRAVPGVSSAATVTGLPLLGTSDGMNFSLVGGPSYSDPSKRPGTDFQSVSPDYFKTFGIDVIQGRAFTPQDTSTSVRVAMVNQEFVRRYLQGLDPLQQRIAMEEIIPGSPQVGPVVEWQIVGVFHNVRDGSFREDRPEMDVPFTQSLQRNVNIGVRTARDPGAMAHSIAAAVHSVDPHVARRPRPHHGPGQERVARRRPLHHVALRCLRLRCSASRRRRNLCAHGLRRLPAHPGNRPPPGPRLRQRPRDLAHPARRFHPRRYRPRPRTRRRRPHRPHHAQHPVRSRSHGRLGPAHRRLSSCCSPRCWRRICPLAAPPPSTP